MAQLNSQALTRAALVPALTAANSGGDTFSPSDRTFLVVNNASGAGVTVTVVTQKNDHLGNPVADNAVVVAAGTTAWMGPYPHEDYASASDGLAHVSYSAVTSVTVGAVELQP